MTKDICQNDQYTFYKNYYKYYMIFKNKENIGT